ncbi:MAG: UDP-N-acetylglucosamine 2-epimerase [Candidatus Rifleibacteriota bacterium]
MFFLLRKEPEIVTELIATGSHLDKTGDYSIEEICAAGAEPFAKICILDQDFSSNTKFRATDALARLYAELPRVLKKLAPDIVVVLGDRYEIFGVASICRLLGICIAHISGGELTFGSFDDCLRHSITKLSDLHFVATEQYRKKVAQLGENPERIFNVGEPGLYGFSKMKPLSKEELSEKTGFTLPQNFGLLTFHPETCYPGKVSSGLKKVFAALTSFLPELSFIFTSANADPEGKEINFAIKEFAESHSDKVYQVASLGRESYLSLASYSAFVGGNSSSGIVEIPALKIPVLNFGLRQRGRPQSKAILNVDYDENRIIIALKKILSREFKDLAKTAKNPYEGENSIQRIAEILIKTDLEKLKGGKEFFDK